MTKLTIYGFPQSTYVRTARMACEEKGAPYELSMLGFSSDALPELHPFRKIPAARHGDVHLYETSAICRYVDAAFDGPAIVPADPAAAARMEQWISVVNAYVDPPVIRQIVSERVVRKMQGGQIDEDKCAAAVPLARHALSVVNDRLAASAYLAGAEISIADFFLLPIIFYFRSMPEGAAMLPDFAALTDWYDRVEARPGAQATVPPPPGERLT